MCGGNGSRLWPLSTRAVPKPFHAIAGEETLLHGTLARAAALRPHHMVVVGHKDHGDLIAQELARHKLPSTQVLLEPAGRNTAAAIALALKVLEAEHSDRALVVMPADHRIARVAAFVGDIRKAIGHCEEVDLVLLGVAPSKPESGYGYAITTEKAVEPVRRVLRFEEKPHRRRVHELLSSGQAFVNSGIFVFSIGKMARLFATTAEGIWQKVEQCSWQPREGEGPWLPDPDTWSSIDAAPFDKAIVERAGNVALIPAQFSWADLGSWDAVARHKRVPGSKCLIDTPELETRLIGKADLAIIQRGDRLLVQQIDDGGLYPGSQRAAVRNWLANEVASTWIDYGFDKRSGCFFEQLTGPGNPDFSGTRLRTQARQIWSFARGQALGWWQVDEDVIDLATSHLSARLGPALRSHGLEEVAPFCQTSLYDHAWCLKAADALVSIHHRDAGLLQAAALAAVRKRTSGFDASAFDSVPTNDLMHLFDALASHAARHQNEEIAAMATQLGDHVSRKRFDLEQGEVREEPSTATGIGRGMGRVPGHAMEWIWLMREHAEYFPSVPAEFSLTAWDRVKGRQCSAVTGLPALDSTTVTDIAAFSSRCWAQCETVRAAIALAGHRGYPGALVVEREMQLLFRHHLGPAEPGLWWDRIDYFGDRLDRSIPASILSHLVGCFAAYLDWAEASAVERSDGFR